MGLWRRVFGRNETPVPAADVAALVAQLDAAVLATFIEDDSVWLRAELALAPGSTPIHLERFLATEPGIRHELNSWAAYLETCDYDPAHLPLMERIIQTRQLFTIRRPIDHPDEVAVDRVCLALCRFLATAADGVFQSDDEGFFDADGTLLLQEY